MVLVNDHLAPDSIWRWARAAFSLRDTSVTTYNDNDIVQTELKGGPAQYSTPWKSRELNLRLVDCSLYLGNVGRVNNPK